MKATSQWLRIIGVCLVPLPTDEVRRRQRELARALLDDHAFEGEGEGLGTTPFGADLEVLRGRLRRKLPKATIVYDHFHVIKLFNAQYPWIHVNFVPGKSFND